MTSKWRSFCRKASPPLRTQLLMYFGRFISPYYILCSPCLVYWPVMSCQGLLKSNGHR